MNREIKFRYFDKEQKKIYYDVQDTYDREFMPRNWENDKYILMQYTWLKDKNWKEIYEGDIVCEKETVMSDREEIMPNYINIRKDDNFKYYDWTIGKRRYWQKIYIVERDDCSCWFEPFADSKYNCWHCWWWINWNSIKIIGNIYKNPELLSLTNPQNTQD